MLQRIQRHKMGKQQDWFVSAYVFLFLSLASQIHYTNQQSLKEKDLIKNLYGQPPVNFKQYGGYVHVDESGGRFFYYYFVEAIKPNSPLVIWFNGGPGCSSLRGAFLGHGPFRIQSDGKTLFHNPYSWNNEANVLYIESPTETGFSYTNTPKIQYLEGEQGNMTTNNNYVFLLKWLERFPEYKEREIYLSGESFAGHYVPQLAQMVLHRNNQTFVNLRGILIGNPGLDRRVENKALYEFYAQRGLAPKQMWETSVQLCKNTSDDDSVSKCLKARDNISNLGNHLENYNIYAPSKCLNTTLTSNPKKHSSVMDYDPCGTDYMAAYLNEAKAQEAMHARTNTEKLPYKWKQCNDDIIRTWNDNDTYALMSPILQELKGNGVRIFIYSGDLDTAVSVTATMKVLKQMNLTVEKEWHPWFSEREVGGFTEKYKGNFTFATVRGAGHVVPTDQPVRALTILTSFIRNIPLPLL